MTIIPQNRVITTQYKKLTQSIFEKIMICNLTIIYAQKIELITNVLCMKLRIYERYFYYKNTPRRTKSDVVWVSDMRGVLIRNRPCFEINVE